MAGVPPPPDLPAPLPGSTPGIGVGGDFSSGDLGIPPSVSICGFSIPLPSFAFSFFIPFPSYALPLPFLFSFSLVCDLDDPLDAEITFGGGRQPTGQQPDPFSQDV